MPYRICLISLGCAKNQVNSEQMLYLLNQAGHDVVGEVDGCDVAIVNTCGFIDTAKSEAIDQILQLAEVKKAGGLKKILVAGCLSQRYENDILESLPEVDGMLGTGSFGRQPRLSVLAPLPRPLVGTWRASWGNRTYPKSPGASTRRLSTTS